MHLLSFTLCSTSPLIILSTQLIFSIRHISKASKLFLSARSNVQVSVAYKITPHIIHLTIPLLSSNCRLIVSSFFLFISKWTKLCPEMRPVGMKKAKQKEERKETKMWYMYFTYVPRPPTLHDDHLSYHVGCSSKHNQLSSFVKIGPKFSDPWG